MQDIKLDRCCNCLFYNERNNECRYNPPVAVPIMKQGIAGGDQHMSAAGIFPAANPDFWCGKHRRRATGDNGHGRKN